MVLEQKNDVIFTGLRAGVRDNPLGTKHFPAVHGRWPGCRAQTAKFKEVTLRGSITQQTTNITGKRF
jgi:hypothetical protein